MLEVRWDSSNRLLSVHAYGRVTHYDYENQLFPAVERAVTESGKINLLYHLGSEFEDFDMRAIWDDTRFGLVHRRDFRRVAVVTDDHSVSRAARAFGILAAGEVQVFSNDKLDNAEVWARSGAD